MNTTGRDSATTLAARTAGRLISLAAVWPIIFCTPAAGAAPRGTITIAADVWCPINCDPATGREGIGIDLARRVFEPMGYRVSYKIVPWSRAMEDVRGGDADAVVGANTADDNSLVFPQEPISLVTDDFYTLGDKKFPFSGIASLRGKRLGVISDYGYGEPLRLFLASQRRPGMVQVVSGEDALDQNIRKLLARRIDVIVETGLIMKYKLREEGLSRQITHIGGMPQGHVYLAFSPALKRSRELAEQFDAAVARLRAAGELTVLYAAYGMKAP